MRARGGIAAAARAGSLGIKAPIAFGRQQALRACLGHANEPTNAGGAAIRTASGEAEAGSLSRQNNYSSTRDAPAEALVVPQ